MITAPTTHRTITRDELRREIGAGNVTVVEALPPSYFDEAHLPGAINLPHEQVEELAPQLLPSRSAKLVVYCANTPCPNSTLAVRRLGRLGYTNVFEYVEGKQDWIDAGYPVERSA
jgi:rhodanese-related sulfurtransferase